MFPEVTEANQPIGKLSSGMAQTIGLPAGVPVFVPIGDHQASFLGSVTDAATTALLNVGTGAQVAAFTSGAEFEPPVELRPFPIHGNLLSSVGLAGGWSFQVVESFFRDIGRRLFGADLAAAGLYESMIQLASEAAPGTGGLRCEPSFAGTRADASQRGSVTGLSAQNFTAAYFTRAVLEGMARDYREAYERIVKQGGVRHARLAAAGNGLRANRVLAQIVQDAMGMPICVTRHREEAAFGAALIAAVGSGICSDLPQASRRVQYA
jgi:sugar (pentulose or hexulose) kinase